MQPIQDTAIQLGQLDSDYAATMQKTQNKVETTTYNLISILEKDLYKNGDSRLETILEALNKLKKDETAKENASNGESKNTRLANLTDKLKAASSEKPRHFRCLVNIINCLWVK